MNNNRQNATHRYGRPVLIAMTLLCAPVTSVTAASTVTVDGIRSAGEYSGTLSGKQSLLWFNDHHSVYTQEAGHTNDLYWEMNDGGANQVSLNLFVEVPTYARRMIWEDGCNYSGGDAGCRYLGKSYLDAYEAGSHHDSVKMDYKTQTSSEYFQLNGLSLNGKDAKEEKGGKEKKGKKDKKDKKDDKGKKGGKGKKGDKGDSLKIKWQDEDSNGLSDNLTWATSREYLLKNGICTTDLCLEYERTSSLELMVTGLADISAAQNLLFGISSLQLHLSDEARGLPPVAPVPLPAGVLLFGSALLGLFGFRRFAKKNG